MEYKICIKQNFYKLDVKKKGGEKKNFFFSNSNIKYEEINVHLDNMEYEMLKLK